MTPLLTEALPWLPAGLGPLLVLLLVPLLGKRGRTVATCVLAGLAVTACVAAAFEGSAPRSLDVVNVFPGGDDGRQLHSHVLEEVTRPGWAWGVTLALFLLLAMAVVHLRRERAGRPPGLVGPAFWATAWLLLLRLALEQAAAPQGLVWATGISMAMPLVLLFQGIYAGRRDAPFGRLVGALMLLAVLQRGLLVGVAWVLTTWQLGTHLDVSELQGFHSWLLGDHDFSAATTRERWLWAIVVAQAMWAAGHVILGLFLGGAGRALARRRG